MIKPLKVPIDGKCKETLNSPPMYLHLIFKYLQIISIHYQHHCYLVHNESSTYLNIYLIFVCYKVSPVSEVNAVETYCSSNVHTDQSLNMN